MGLVYSFWQAGHYLWTPEFYRYVAKLDGSPGMYSLSTHRILPPLIISVIYTIVSSVFKRPSWSQDNLIICYSCLPIGIPLAHITVTSRERLWVSITDSSKVYSGSNKEKIKLHITDLLCRECLHKGPVIRKVVCHGAYIRHHNSTEHKLYDEYDDFSSSIRAIEMGVFPVVDIGPTLPHYLHNWRHTIRSRLSMITYTVGTRSIKPVCVRLCTTPTELKMH